MDRVIENSLPTTLEAFLSAGDAMPQAYLFMAAQVGKKTTKIVAETFAERITGMSFPNVDTVQFDAADGSGVEGIREVLQLAALMPVAGFKKVVMMENMDFASPQMLSALLKILEEPPQHAVFVLVSTRPLLSTIMSRCQLVNLPKNGEMAENSPELIEAIALLETNRRAGLAERLALVNTLANLEDDLLPQLIEQWLYLEVQQLKQEPQKFKAVRACMETLQALRGNFNKKMVLQNFVTTGLV